MDESDHEPILRAGDTCREIATADRVAAADPARDAAALAAELAAGLPSPVDDGTASAPYRRRVIPILIRRLLEASSTEPQA